MKPLLFIEKRELKMIYSFTVYNFLGILLTQVIVGENEGVESALRRFKREVSKAGIFNELKRIRHHETPVEKYKRKQRLKNRTRRRK